MQTGIKSSGVFQVFACACVRARSRLKISPLSHRKWLSSSVDTRASTSLPVIDLSAFTNSSESEIARQDRKLETAYKFREACSQTGFFYLTGHGIKECLLKESLSFARRFFDLPAEQKNKISISLSEDNSRGYQKLGENVTGGKSDAHEAFDAMREIGWNKKLRSRTGYPPQQVYHGGHNLWPDEAAIPGFRDFYEREYWPAMTYLGEQMMRCFALSLEIDEYSLLPIYDESFFVFRAIHYPPGNSNVDTGSAGCGEHTDYGCFTFVHAESVPGALEVRTRSGKYIKPEFKEGMFVCNIGDMIELLTGGLYVSTKHRVARTSQSRISVPFFFELNYDSYVEPLLSSPFVKAVCSSNGNPKHDFALRYGDHLYQKTSTNFVQVD